MLTVVQNVVQKVRSRLYVNVILAFFFVNNLVAQILLLMLN